MGNVGSTEVEPALADPSVTQRASPKGKHVFPVQCRSGRVPHMPLLPNQKPMPKELWPCSQTEGVTGRHQTWQRGKTKGTSSFLLFPASPKWRKGGTWGFAGRPTTDGRASSAPSAASQTQPTALALDRLTEPAAMPAAPLALAAALLSAGATCTCGQVRSE